MEFKVIGLMYDVKTDWLVGGEEPLDTNAEFDKPHTIDLVEQALQSGGHRVIRIGNVEKLLACIDRLEVDIVMNLCEGRSGRNRESEVPMLLEMRGIPFIGADALTLGLTLDKVMAKKIFIAEGIPTPQFFTVEPNENSIVKNTIEFPLMVKTRHEGSSKGISQGSHVVDDAGLIRQVTAIHQDYRQPALVEQFIRGTEFTVAVIGNTPPEAMPVVQVSINGSVDLGDQVYTFDHISSASLAYVCPAPISEELAQQLQSLAVRVFQAVDCRDFGRVDFRVDEEGCPYVLEINPLPSLDEEDVFHLFPKELGSDFNQTILRIVDAAFSRYDARLQLESAS